MFGLVERSANELAIELASRLIGDGWLLYEYLVVT
jgi:hypothetical protein